MRRYRPRNGDRDECRELLACSLGRDGGCCRRSSATLCARYTLRRPGLADLAESLDAEAAARLAITGHFREQIANAINDGARAGRAVETRDWNIYARQLQSPTNLLRTVDPKARLQTSVGGKEARLYSYALGLESTV